MSHDNVEGALWVLVIGGFVAIAAARFAGCA
jgi:hypothetical protein